VAIDSADTIAVKYRVDICNVSLCMDDYEYRKVCLSLIFYLGVKNWGRDISASYNFKSEDFFDYENKSST